MSLGVTIVAGLGLLVALALAGGSVHLATQGGLNSVSLSAKKASILLGVQGLGITVVVGSPAVVGMAFWELAPETIGLNESVIALPLGIGVGCASFGVFVGVKTPFEAAGLSFSQPFEDAMPKTGWEMGCYAGGIAVASSAEELLFRGSLIGAMAAILSVSPWLLIVPSAILFGFAHADRGSGHIVVLTLLGIGWGILFVFSGLVAAAIAHVVTNGLYVFYLGFVTNDKSTNDSHEQGTSV
ncbi:CPBP family intramembrane glutamic endopeptidase [Halovenus rubra]|uniref:CPBP family intramembrane glutamic endopeptidase n=2 Tax=Halovenus rubra TaxID=869890 RepID=A0ACC7E152_9EURY|nr:CPBP family intramembrane glutamic endopeptidase [Halovenus rubra]